MISLGLVGPGRVGRTLVTLLPRDRFRLGPVLSHNLVSARRAGRLMEIGEPSDDPKDLSSCDVILICTPDEVLEPVVERLANAQGSHQGKVVLHTSGSFPSSVLRPLADRGAAIGSMHPLFLFQKPVLSLAGVHFTVEGAHVAAQMARTMIQAWDAEFELIKPEHKVRHAIARSMVSDLLTGLLEGAVRQMMQGGFSRKRAFQAVSRILGVTVKEYSRVGRSGKAGPLLQGAVERARRDLAALHQIDPLAAEDYRRHARETLRVLGRASRQSKLLDEA